MVDGDAGLGLVVAPKAMDIAITKAKNAGTGWVAVKNSKSFWYCGSSRHDGFAARYDRHGDD